MLHGIEEREVELVLGTEPNGGCNVCVLYTFYRLEPSQAKNS